MEKQGRRRFLRLALSAGAGIGAGGALRRFMKLPEPKQPPAFVADASTTGKLVGGEAPPPGLPGRDLVGVPGRRWVMVIDLARCDGCKLCTVACQKMHFLPDEQEWIKVYKKQDSSETAPYWFPRPCMQCDNPPCVKVCPVAATYKRTDGIIMIDEDRCIGCRYCIAACPYSARFFNWSEPKNPPEALAHPYSPETGWPHRRGTAEKCNFCPHLLRAGKLPACASGCPMGAIYFGDAEEDAVTNSLGETEPLSKLLEKAAAYRELEDLGTKPRVYYLPARNRQFPVPSRERKEGTP